MSSVLYQFIGMTDQSLDTGGASIQFQSEILPIQSNEASLGQGTEILNLRRGSGHLAAIINFLVVALWKCQGFFKAHGDYV